MLAHEARRVWQANMQVYGVRKVWRQLHREGLEVGSARNAYDNAMAETINGTNKTKVINKRAPWKTRECVELATLE